MSKLDDLRATVEAMTPGEWDALVLVLSNGHDISRSFVRRLEPYAAIADGCLGPNATGIVALRNAAPALLAVVDAVDAFLTANDATLAGDRYYIPRAHAVEKLRAARKRLEDLP